MRRPIASAFNMFHGLMPRLFVAFFAVTLVVGLIASSLVNYAVRGFFLTEVEEHLLRHGQALSRLLSDDAVPAGPESLGERVARWSTELDLRLTMITTDGTVLADSHTDAAMMENHLDRPEIAAALKGDVGRGLRRSETTGVETLYVAVPLSTETAGSHPAILRTAIPLTSVLDSLTGMRRVMLWITLGLLAGSALFAYLFARRIVRPIKEMTFFAHRIAQGSFEPRLQISAQGEIGQLANAFNTMATRLEETLGELSKQRAHLQAVVGSMAEGVVAVDATGRMILINPAAQLMFDLSEDAIGRRIQDVVQIRSMVQAIENTLKDRKGHLVEFELPAPSRRIVRAHTAILQSNGRQEGGALGLIYDITELRHLERVRTDFVANVSHELRTPLTSIHGFTETLLDGADEDPTTRHRFLEIIKRESERVTAIINDLLDLSRLESDKLDVTLSLIRLRDVIDETLPLVADVAAQKRIDMTVNVSPDLVVLADEALLRQVFINLLDNAVKYTPEDGGRVTVDATAEGNMVKVTLSDTGIGIPEGDLPRIFERFYRVDRARSRQLGGTGLGLSIVRHIVERLGGTIYAESTLGEGTTMVFTLRAGRSAKGMGDHA